MRQPQKKDKQPSFFRMPELKSKKMIPTTQQALLIKKGYRKIS
jgi:hypothetical protein